MISSHFGFMPTVIIILALVATGEGYCPKAIVNAKEDQPATNLTKKEAAALRDCIFNKRLRIGTRIDENGFPQRELSLVKEVVAIHKDKRLATIKLLLEIVKGGRPQDAFAAAVTAIALEDSPATAAVWIYVDIDSFDEEDPTPANTLRERLVLRLEKSIAKIEKELRTKR